MITQTGRELFYSVYNLIDIDYEEWADIQESISLLSRNAKTHRNLCEYSCNGDPVRQMYGHRGFTNEMIDSMAIEREDKAEKRLESLDKRIKQIVKGMPKVKLEMQHDPRGSTVVLIAECDDGKPRQFYIN